MLSDLSIKSNILKFKALAVKNIIYTATFGGNNTALCTTAFFFVRQIVLSHIQYHPQGLCAAYSRAYQQILEL